LRRLQIVELSLEFLDFRLVVLLDISDFALQLFDLLVHRRRCLRLSDPDGFSIYDARTLEDGNPVRAQLHHDSVVVLREPDIIPPNPSRASVRAHREQYAQPSPLRGADEKYERSP